MSPVKTSKVMVRAAPRRREGLKKVALLVAGAGHTARWIMPSTVSVIIPWTKSSGTGRNCALSEKPGLETRLK